MNRLPRGDSMLILTEKPSVAKDFASALGCTYSNGLYKNGATVITNCIGHLFELEEPDHYGKSFPIIPNHFDYRINPSVAKQAKFVIATLKAHISDSILIATDADREGEIIARECLAQAGIKDFSNIKRFWVSEALTPEVVKNGIKNSKPLSEYNRLAEQGFARQHADWLTGMNFCRYITQAANRKLVVGRVQTAILSAIEQRDNAIKNFKSEKYFEHYGNFQPAGSESSCCGIYFEDDKTGFSDNSREEKLKECIGKKAKLIDSKIENKIQNPPQLYNLNALQKDAFKLYGYSAEKTLKIVQSLYEELKCVSYPRTPSRVMGSNNVELCQKVAIELSKKYSYFNSFPQSMNITTSNKRCFNDAKLEAHHALIPLKELPAKASDEQQNIYYLIFDSFFEAFLPPCEYEKQTFLLEVESNKFKISGKKILSEGFKSAEFQRYLHRKDLSKDIYNKQSSGQNDDENPDNEQLLDNIDWNTLNLYEIETKEKWTKAPPYFNEASILSFMENPKMQHVPNEQTEDFEPIIAIPAPGFKSEAVIIHKFIGLGTAATRHTFIPKLTKYGYISVEKKNIVVTELGEALLKSVRNSAIKSLADISATTDWEERLDKNPTQFLNDIKSFVKESVIQSVKIDIPIPSANNIICPACGKEIRKGKTNWYCIGYKEGCEFTLWETTAGAKLTEKDVATLCEGKQTGIKHCISKAGKTFDCRFKLNEEKKISFVFEGK